MPPQARRP
ncbi:hypothetical protein A2U01_0079669, partial [Trifolium medium]|nr:hypothetical protein [Trifolium medium]MCI58414.1 hypothetical protein [Trifolium medium]